MIKNQVNFRGSYLIPFEQIKTKNSEEMRKIGEESSKYVSSPNDIVQTNEGIVVKVDDISEAQFESAVAKYGINVQKYNGVINKNDNLEIDSYSFMVRNLYKKDAPERIENFKNMSDNEKGVEYAKVYSEFKNSSYSAEHNSGLMKPKLKPTGSPIVQFSDKNGENYMAREVQLENGYVCMAVSNVDNPSEATLMNKDVFKEFLTKTKS